MPPWLEPVLTLAALAAMAAVLLPRWQALAAAVICLLTMWLVLHPETARQSPILGMIFNVYRQAAVDVQAIGRLTPLR